MNRELKFRAWDGEKMQPAFDLTQNPKYWWEGNKDYPLMQYTGLKDKNGVEIYEGDIIVGRNHKDEAGEPRRVEWSDSGYHADHLPIWAIHKSEVIGNIYENHDLLEAKQ